jgi:ribonuclease HIII
MKYIIAESYKEKIVFKYLDKKNYNLYKQKLVDHPGVKTSRLYFMYESEEYADIVYHYWSGKLFINGELQEEIMNFFGMDDLDAEVVISQWVEDKINKKIEIINVSVMYKTSFAGELLKPDRWE